MPPPVQVRELISATDLAKRIADLGRGIADAYADAPRAPVLLVVLRGAFVFAADLLRAIGPRAEVMFVGASSYGARQVSSGQVRWTLDLPEGALSDRDVVIVEDIVDTGRTTSSLLGLLKMHHAPRSVEVCTLLHKPARTEIPVPLRFVGFVIPDEFVIGYGLDLDQLFRGLPFVGSL